jgi:hypothetical protein
VQGIGSSTVDEAERYGILTIEKGIVNQRFTVQPVAECSSSEIMEKGAPASHESVETLSCSAEHQNLRPILKKRVNGVKLNIGECQTDITAVDSVRVSHFFFAFSYITCYCTYVPTYM